MSKSIEMVICTRTFGFLTWLPPSINAFPGAHRHSFTRRLARLRLTIHAGAHPRPVTEGLPFLGFTVYPHRRRLKRRKGIHFARKLRMLSAQYQGGELPLSALTARVRCWASHASHGNTVGLRKAIFGSLRLRPSRIRRQKPPVPRPT
jgi:hypothetical protein